MANINGKLEKLRVDKWLWAARFFKTRRLATEAIVGGKVHVNGERTKPSRVIRCGDGLQITRGVNVYHVVVLGLNKYRRPACEAVLLYQESAESIEQRDVDQETRRLLNVGSKANKRPDKRERRKIRHFVRKE
jgi:ribosome-associated heat shock protein Hsp15